MHAQRIIEGSACGPEVLNVAANGFEEAWSAVAHKFPEQEHQAAREAMALAIMSATRSDTSDSTMLRDVALRAIRMCYPKRFL
ncbi:MAG: hypothetical protein BGN89_11625 [Alphaproteobacteria bacterium 64-6]|jgi:glutathionylspermidine synthase|nr:MAG: hypothetical protein BGN89_11625 [Alphaproteobacteria bacterium 64-6]